MLAEMGEVPRRALHSLHSAPTSREAGRDSAQCLIFLLFSFHFLLAPLLRQLKYYNVRFIFSPHFPILFPALSASRSLSHLRHVLLLFLSFILPSTKHPLSWFRNHSINPYFTQIYRFLKSFLN